MVKDHLGNKKMNAENIAEVWRKYCVDLFKGEPKEDFQIDHYDIEPGIMRSEVQKAIIQLKNRKSAGTDRKICR